MTPYCAIKYEVQIYNRCLYRIFNWSCSALTCIRISFEGLCLPLYYFTNTVKKFLEIVHYHKCKREILEMFKTVIEACPCGEGIVEMCKYYSNSIQTPSRPLSRKAFLWFSLIRFQSGLEKALLTYSQGATIEELFLDILGYFSM